MSARQHVSGSMFYAPGSLPAYCIAAERRIPATGCLQFALARPMLTLIGSPSRANTQYIVFLLGLVDSALDPAQYY